MLLDTLKAALFTFCVGTFSAVEQMLCCSATLSGGAVRSAKQHHHTKQRKIKKFSYCFLYCQSISANSTVTGAEQLKPEQVIWSEEHMLFILIYLFIYLTVWHFLKFLFHESPERYDPLFLAEVYLQKENFLFKSITQQRHWWSKSQQHFIKFQASLFPSKLISDQMKKQHRFKYIYIYIFLNN